MPSLGLNAKIDAKIADYLTPTHQLQIFHDSSKISTDRPFGAKFSSAESQSGAPFVTAITLSFRL